MTKIKHPADRQQRRLLNEKKNNKKPKGRSKVRQLKEFIKETETEDELREWTKGNPPVNLS